MSLFSFILVSISAFSHAFWNFLGKRQNPPAAFFLKASLAASILFSPVLFYFRGGIAFIPIEVWGLILGTGLIQAIYYIFLAGAYRTGDLSLAYPLARSLPVILVAIVSAILGRGSQIQPLAYFGFFAVAAGCVLLPLPGFSELKLKHYRHPWVFFALMAALCITGYTLIDDQSLRMLRSIPASPLTNLGWSLLFLELETISLTIFLIIILACWRLEREKFFLASRSEWRLAALMGFIITATYGLVLLAMAYVKNVSYISAFRQLSIPIGSLLGILVGKEKMTLPKMAGTGLVVLGLLLAVL